MPHFTLGILIPSHETDIETFVDRQVEPYASGDLTGNCDGFRLIRRSDEWVTGAGPWLAGVRNTGRAGRDTYSRDPNVVDNAFATTEQALAREIIPHALITAKGRRWRNHYFIWGPGETHEDFPQWRRTVRRLLRRHPDHRLLILVTSN